MKTQPHRRLVTTLGWILALVGTASAQSPAERPLELEAGAHHRVLQWSRPEATDRPGSPAPVPEIVHLETGLHRLERGRWVETEESIEAHGNRAVARRTAHRVIWMANAHTRGAVDIELPDGGRLRGHCLGLGYYDAATGHSVLIAEVKDCQAEIRPPNLLVYPNAFDDLEADLIYLNRKIGLEQFVVLQEAPPPPEHYGFDPVTTRLEVISEFLDQARPRREKRMLRREADPQRREGMVEPDLVDERLDFGAMFMGPGRAFLPPAQDRLLEADEPIPMAKRWEVIEGRCILFEAVEYDSLRPWLAALRPSPEGRRWAVHRMSSGTRTIPAPRPAPTGAGSVLASAGGGFPAGLVLDYALHTTIANQVFQGNTTYYVAGPLTLSGSNTTFEAGTVIKFAPGVNAGLDIASTKLTWLGTTYQPVILTARDDASVGAPLTSWTPGGYYAETALRFPGPVQEVTLENLRVAYARTALAFPQGGSPQISHAQVVNCQTGLKIGSADLRVRNALFAGVNLPFDLGAGIVRAEHVTVNGATQLNTSPALFLTNCLLVGVTSTNAWTGTANGVAASPTMVFTSVAAGAHYLTESSPHRNAGTFAIHPALLTALRGLTTSAPQPMTEPLTRATTLAPRVRRDIDQPDRGYHYAPIDYLVSNLALRAELTLTNGVAIGLCGNQGLDLQMGAGVMSEGRPGRLNCLAGLGLVQEQPLLVGQPKAMTLNHALAKPRLRFRFTRCALKAGATATVFEPGTNPFAEFSWRDSQLSSVSFSAAPASSTPVLVAFTNNVLERCSLSFAHSLASQHTPYQVLLFNNLLRDGTLALTYHTGTVNPAWAIQDNLFDGTQSSTDGGGLGYYVQRSHNGFLSGTTNGLGGTSNKIILARDFQPGPLGSSYYPTSGPGLNQLRNAGSRASAATAGLFHYTTTVDQTKENATVLDIGFHYVATNAGGNPLDGEGDGVADYQEDLTGNGAFDPLAGESDWLTSGHGLVGVAALQVFTPLR